MSVWRAGLEPVSRWSAPASEDGRLDADEDRRVLGFDQLRQFIVASVLEAVDRDRGARRRPALSGCAGRC